LDPLPDDQVLDEIPAGERILRDAADILYGMALGRRGEIDRAAEFAFRRIHQEKAAHGSLLIPTLVPLLASMYMFQGRLHATDSLCREFLDTIKEKGIRISTAGNLDVILGDTLYEWNYLEEAEERIRDGLQANELWGNIMTDALGLLALTHVLLAKGDYTGAMQIVDKFETRLQAPSRPTEFAEDYRTLRIRVQLASGDLQNTSKWADKIQLSEDFHLHPEYYRFTLARIRLAQGRFAEVEEMLVGMPHQALAGNRIVRQIETNLLRATAIAGQQRLPEAFELIDSCLALAEPEGYVRVFFNMAGQIQELLAAYLRSAVAAHKFYAQKLLDACSPSSAAGSAGPQPGGLVEPLSGRELEVLDLMALGRTNQEIAGQLIVAPGTIKAHAAAIYRKLDVANRTEAVARARQLGILP
jgi:LuxR family maltose regulon positive regulatory protein